MENKVVFQLHQSNESIRIIINCSPTCQLYLDGNEDLLQSCFIGLQRLYFQPQLIVTAATVAGNLMSFELSADHLCGTILPFMILEQLTSKALTGAMLENFFTVSRCYYRLTLTVSGHNQSHVKPIAVELPVGTIWQLIILAEYFGTKQVLNQCVNHLEKLFSYNEKDGRHHLSPNVLAEIDPIWHPNIESNLLAFLSRQGPSTLHPTSKAPTATPSKSIDHSKCQGKGSRDLLSTPQQQGGSILSTIAAGFTPGYAVPECSLRTPLTSNASDCSSASNVEVNAHAANNLKSRSLLVGMRDNCCQTEDSAVVEQNNLRAQRLLQFLYPPKQIRSATDTQGNYGKGRAQEDYSAETASTTSWNTTYDTVDSCDVALDQTSTLFNEESEVDIKIESKSRQNAVFGSVPPVGRNDLHLRSTMERPNRALSRRSPQQVQESRQYFHPREEQSPISRAHSPQPLTNQSESPPKLKYQHRERLMASLPADHSKPFTTKGSMAVASKTLNQTMNRISTTSANSKPESSGQKTPQSNSFNKEDLELSRQIAVLRLKEVKIKAELEKSKQLAEQTLREHRLKELEIKTKALRVTRSIEGFDDNDEVENFTDQRQQQVNVSYQTPSLARSKSAPRVRKQLMRSQKMDEHSQKELLLIDAQARAAERVRLRKKELAEAEKKKVEEEQRRQDAKLQARNDRLAKFTTERLVKSENSRRSELSDMIHHPGVEYNKQLASLNLLSGSPPYCQAALQAVGLGCSQNLATQHQQIKVSVASQRSNRTDQSQHKAIGQSKTTDDLPSNQSLFLPQLDTSDEFYEREHQLLLKTFKPFSVSPSPSIHKLVEREMESNVGKDKQIIKVKIWQAFDLVDCLGGTHPYVFIQCGNYGKAKTPAILNTNAPRFDHTVQFVLPKHLMIPCRDENGSRNPIYLQVYVYSKNQSISDEMIGWAECDLLSGLTLDGEGSMITLPLVDLQQRSAGYLQLSVHYDGD